MIEHGRGDHTWASQLDDMDMIVLGKICEAVHESLPVVPWEDFIKTVSREENDNLVIDWIANTKDKLWLRFSHDPGNQPFWAITFTDLYKVESVGFMPLQSIGMKQDASKRLQILGLMDDLVLQPRI
jgi:hypothetical protein